MKTIVLALSLSLAAFSATAQTNSASSSTTSATSGATNAGNTQGITLQFQIRRFRHLAHGARDRRTELLRFILVGQLHGVGGRGGSVVGFGMNVAFPIEDQKRSLRRNFERTMQAAASTRIPTARAGWKPRPSTFCARRTIGPRPRWWRRGCAPIPPLTTADHRFDNSAVAQTSAPPAAPAALAPTPQTPVAQAFRCNRCRAAP